MLRSRPTRKKCSEVACCVVEYKMRSPDDILFGIGAGCEGAIRVLLEPAGPGTRATAALGEASQYGGEEFREGTGSSLATANRGARATDRTCVRTFRIMQTGQMY